MRTILSGEKEEHPLRRRSVTRKRGIFDRRASPDRLRIKGKKLENLLRKILPHLKSELPGFLNGNGIIVGEMPFGEKGSNPLAGFRGVVLTEQIFQGYSELANRFFRNIRKDQGAILDIGKWLFF
jgi:hypothetical protein